MTPSTSPQGPGATTAYELVRRSWWVFLFGGLASIAFGLLALLSPGTALLVLATFFAASVLVDGGVSMYGAIQHRDKDGWWLMGLIGVLGVAVGAYALLHPPVAIAAFVLMVAFQAIVLGALTVMLGWHVRKATRHEWMLYVTGALSIALGILIVSNPLAGSLSIVTLVAIWAIGTGFAKTVLGANLKMHPPVRTDPPGARS